MILWCLVAGETLSLKTKTDMFHFAFTFEAISKHSSSWKRPKFWPPAFSAPLDSCQALRLWYVWTCQYSLEWWAQTLVLLQIRWRGWRNSLLDELWQSLGAISCNRTVFSLFFPDSESYSGYWLGFFTSNIREVLGATWLLFCLLHGRCLVPWLDLWLLFWVLFWEWKLQRTLDNKLNSFDQFQDHSWQQKKKVEGSTNKFGGCKFGTQSKATVGWACSYDETKGFGDGAANTQGI